MVVKPALLYGVECWPFKKTQTQRLMVAEKRMIRWMCGCTRLDRHRNVVIREKMGVAPIEEKLREIRWRWFRYVKRSVGASVRSCEEINLQHCKRGRGRPKMSWNEVVRGDMKCLGLMEDMAQDRNTLRAKIKTIEYR